MPFANNSRPPAPPRVFPAAATGLSRRGFVAGCLLAGWAGENARVEAAPPVAAVKEKPVQFDGNRAYAHLKEICALGPRPSGSDGMSRQQRLVAEHFSKLKAKVRFQSFDAPHPRTGEPVAMNNLVVSWQPQAQERILLCCHYDTRPFPDRDPDPRAARSGVFVGANDGASGVAFLMELGRHMGAIQPRFGVDFVFFDGEELVFQPNDPYFLGSEFFAKSYRDDPPNHVYHYGVLFDMIADKRLNIYQEVYSVQYARSIVQSVWAQAAALEVKEFIPKIRHEIRDDHLALNQLARIPTIDLIDFDYDPWHTTQDIPANCSAASLAKVGKVILAWLQNLPDPPASEGDPETP